MDCGPITLAELARATGIPTRTLRYAVEKGALPARRRGLKRFVVSIADAERYAGAPIDIGKIGKIADNHIATSQHAA